MQYVKCRFRSSDTRLYTYANDGAPVASGDFVKVPDNRDPSAWKRVEVVEVTADAPSFQCKPILGKIEDEPTDAAAEGGAADLASALDDEIAF